MKKLLPLILKHKGKALTALGAGVYVGLGVALGDLDLATAATKFIALVGF